MGLRGQAAGGVGQHDVDTACFSGFHGIEADGGRIAGSLGNHGNAVALAPFGQLLAGSGAESVAGSQQHAFAMSLEIFGQLADGSGFACAVDAGEHNHKRPFVCGQGQRLLQRFNQLVDGLFQCAAQFLAIFQAAQAHALAHFLHQMLGGFNAHIAGEQHGFQLFIQVFVYLAAAKHAGQRLGHLLARFAQALLESGSPAKRGRLLWNWLDSGLVGTGWHYRFHNYLFADCLLVACLPISVALIERGSFFGFSRGCFAHCLFGCFYNRQGIGRFICLCCSEAWFQQSFQWCGRCFSAYHFCACGFVCRCFLG